MAVQPNQPKVKSTDSDLRSKIMAAKNTLGMKNLNVAAAMAGYKSVSAQSEKNPKATGSQILNKVAPNQRQHYMQLGSAVPTDILSAGVPMQQFRSALQKLKQVGRSLNNSVEFDGEIISEATTEPPAMLLLKRVGIRIFPDGRRVAMYNNEKLGISFTIPFGTTGAAGAVNQASGLPMLPTPSTNEEVEQEEIMESLDQVSKYASEENPKSTTRHFKFADGSKMPVAHGAAKAIHMVHGALNPQNKKKFAAMLNDPKGFTKAANFALSKVQFTIGGK